MKNAAIRELLESTAQEVRSKNCFRFGAVEIKIDHDSPIKGVSFTETITVSVYDRETDMEIVWTSNVEDVIILTDTVGND